ncbi:uncharacterized protein LOC132308262 isoform X2 [Cornus florida]|uniref:uncharacterized protein LOC132308262 isoform X2 n=1 Tax=Cornus florida TaxID=4283 RepID=UPI00289925A9|nr:uncharacterized protein LOC132308262 isoform X2 [Cornus florida]
MKCQPVACIWSGSPPVHRVTATAVLNQPPTLYTGGSDGSIVSWNLSANDDSTQEIKPIAMLCGHAAPIADLSICVPVVVTRDGEREKSSNVVLNSKSSDYGALISACTDGVLCIWSRGTGHCRRRRKMPPWVGSPSMVRPLPENPRYVCIACCFIDAVHLSDNQSLDSSEGSEALMNRDSQYRKPSNCSIVIVDSYTLTILQTIFHGNLSLGPLKFMVVVPSVEDIEKQSVLMVDSFGKLQCFPILKDSNPDGKYETSLQKDSSCLERTDWEDGLGERGQVVTFAICRQILVLIYKTYCIFRLMSSGTAIGEISFIDKHLSLDGYVTQSQIIGGMFLDNDNVRKTVNTLDSPDTFAEDFAVWNSSGSATVYRISYSDNIFNFEPVCVIPAAAHPVDVRLSISFIQLKSFLLRIESICFQVEEPLLWKPHVTIWLVPQQHDNNTKSCQECRMLGEGSFLVDWITSSISRRIEEPNHNDNIEPTGITTEITSLQKSVPCQKVDNTYADNANYGFPQKERLVTTSMVISRNYDIPYAVVYGYYTGEIEVVQFDILFGRPDSHGRSTHHKVDSNVSKQIFSGHMGAVLCLAAHQMVGTAKGWSFKQVLVSGSMDCTVRMWDLDSGNLIAVMHQHVAPVRQIILPPPQTDRPWSDCFLSVGQDFCVALTSLSTLRVERMFPGHPYYPAKVVWDGTRGYVACLCQNHSRTSDAIDVLCIWDIKTGARERILRGTASHSMFDYFCKAININSLSGNILNGNTSASSLLLSMTEDANFSKTHLKNSEKGISSSNISPSMTKMTQPNASQVHASKQASVTFPQSNKHPVKCSCPFTGIAMLSFDLASLMSPCQKHVIFKDAGNKQENAHMRQGAETPKAGVGKRVNNILKEQGAVTSTSHHVTADMTLDDGSDFHGTLNDTAVDDDQDQSLERCLLQFSLSFLHMWNVDYELDKLLITDMKLKIPENFIVASGLQGDRGSLTLAFPNLSATVELWKSSSEFCALRSLTMISLAQRMISLSHSCSAASSALAAFYTRNFAEKIPDIKPPSLQLLVSLWQDESEHVRMAARSLFHCAASRAIPLPLCNHKPNDHANLLNSSNGMVENYLENSNIEETSTNKLKSDKRLEEEGISQAEESEILVWLESFEVQDWISCVGGTSQDAMTSHIIVAAALAIWYPSLVKPSLAMLAVHPLMKLVMAMNEKYSSTAAELLAEGMESTWKACIGSEIPRLIGDIFFQIECVSGASANSAAQSPAVPLNILETLVGILLPSLAMADILGFLNVIESQIWSTASDSPVHVVALMTLIRVVRGSPRNLAQYIDKICR